MMRLKFTPAQLQSQAGVMSTLLAKLIEKVRWYPNDLDHAEYQWCFDNNVPVDSAVLFSPVLQQSTLDAFVPTTWAGQPIADDVLQRMTYGEYLRITEVEGGFCLQFSCGPKNIHNSILLPSNAQLLIQIGMAGGFMTKAEVDAIKIVVET